MSARTILSPSFTARTPVVIGGFRDRKVWHSSRIQRAFEEARREDDFESRYDAMMEQNLADEMERDYREGFSGPAVVFVPGMIRNRQVWHSSLIKKAYEEQTAAQKQREASWAIPISYVQPDPVIIVSQKATSIPAIPPKERPSGCFACLSKWWSEFMTWISNWFKYNNG